MEGPAAGSGHRVLRIAGLLLVGTGALLAGFGALSAWVEVGLVGSSVDVITPEELGVDRPEGIVVLALAVVAIVAALMTRSGADAARDRAAVVATVAGIAIVLACMLLVTLGTRRFETAAIDRIKALPEATRPPEELIDGIAELTEARFRGGVWLSLGGGIVVVVGGVTTGAWARRIRPARAEQPVRP
jgi:hypothetical protein